MTVDVTSRQRCPRCPLRCWMCNKDHNSSKNELKLCRGLLDTFNDIYNKFICA